MQPHESTTNNNSKLTTV